MITSTSHNRADYCRTGAKVVGKVVDMPPNIEKREIVDTKEDEMTCNSA
jgi:hypothetical protein